MANTSVRAIPARNAWGVLNLPRSNPNNETA